MDELRFIVKPTPPELRVTFALIWTVPGSLKEPGSMTMLGVTCVVMEPDVSSPFATEWEPWTWVHADRLPFHDSVKVPASAAPGVERSAAMRIGRKRDMGGSEKSVNPP